MKGDAPYESLLAAEEDAAMGAKQIVGDALRGGASIQAATNSQAFEIVDETGSVLADLSFWSLISSVCNEIGAQDA